MTSDQVGGIIRAILAAIAGFFVSKGWVDNTTALAITGAVATVIVAVWSYFTNQPSKIVEPTTAKPKDIPGALATAGIAPRPGGAM